MSVGTPFMLLESVNTVTLCLKNVVDIWIQRVCKILFTWVLCFQAHGSAPDKRKDRIMVWPYYHGQLWGEKTCGTHPRCWHCRSPAHGQCFLGLLSCVSHDSSSIRLLEMPKQRSRSMGLAEQTGKSRAAQKETHDCFYYYSFHWEHNQKLVFAWSVAPLWIAQQRSGLQSVWYWQVLPASPLVAFWLHWPHTHIWSPQHSSSLVQD